MEQLLEQDPVAMGMLGKQTIRDQEYRPLTYVLMVEDVEKKIYYNLLTHEMIAINRSEVDSPDIRRYFIENWYLVPIEHDDQKLVDECRAVLTLMSSWPKKIHTFHIFTTLDCNARCFYCFEKRVPGSDMTIETAARAIEYIQQQAAGEHIKIIWFGGEPLCNYNIIDYITVGLKNKGLHYESEMVSNGILFERELVDKAKNDWNLKRVQITLDGTREIYKRVKAYVMNVEDPFERVIQNINSLLRAEIRVSIRLNVGLYNNNAIRDLVDFLCEVMKGQENLYVYAGPLFQIKGYTEDQREYIYGLIDELNKKLSMYFGQKKKKDFYEKITNSFCMASGQEAVTILPDGKVGICPDNIDDAIIGDIYSEELNLELRKNFGRRYYREDKCRPCPMYPNCYIVNGCPNKDDSEGCDSIRVQMHIKKIKENMKLMCRLGKSDNRARPSL